ncbi:hypothetical protein ARZXY2_4888 (plasmid) [Arthrobacter sp. ZXY-2]|nr:hypothetical protein ARZXY2_4888 [Arthrobacter sp. ZXY-2]
MPRGVHRGSAAAHYDKATSQEKPTMSTLGHARPLGNLDGEC